MMLDLISRNTPKVKDNFILKHIEPIDGCDCYEVYAEDKKIVLAGNSNLSLAMAYYRYLQEYCNVYLTSGDFDFSYIATTPLPKEKLSLTVRQKIRARISYEMFTVEGNYWGFDRWEKEIDFMAMSGINTPLQAVGFDGVIYHTLVDIGMPEDFCLEFSSGPTFLMRQLTGNVAGMNSVSSLDYLERKINLGRQITEREKQLGMSPVFPAAMPSVPFSLRKKYIKMDIFKAPAWYNFPPIFLIKPDNAFFDIFNRKFLTIQRDLLGETHNYIFEPIYDCDKKGYNSYLSSLGKALSDTLGAFDDEAVCYTHLDSINADFFKNISAKRYIIISDKTDSILEGKNFVVSIDGNKYGRTGLCGDVERLCNSPYKKAREKYSTVLGTSISLDTFSENPMYCAAALNALVNSDSVDCDEFVKSYAIKRYGIADYQQAAVRLKNICYNADECAGSIICARPSTLIKHTAPYDSMERKIDFHELYEVADSILSSDLRKNDAMRADIQSIVRQILSELAYPVYLRATEFFKNKDVGNYEQASNLFLEICEDMDRLLKTRSGTNFFTRIDEARQLGANKDEKQQLEINFLLLHTIWGPIDHTILYDTVWNEWGGLVKDYYAQRWFMYFRALAAYFDNPKKLKDVSKKQPLDRNEYKGSYQAKRLAIFENNFIENHIPRKDGICDEDTITVAKEILEKYSQVIKQF